MGSSKVLVRFKITQTILREVDVLANSVEEAEAKLREENGQYGLIVSKDQIIDVKIEHTGETQSWVSDQL